MGRGMPHLGFYHVEGGVDYDIVLLVCDKINDECGG